MPVDGNCEPTQEALDLGWYTPEEAVSAEVIAEMTNGHDRLIRLALAHVGKLPVTESGQVTRMMIQIVSMPATSEAIRFFVNAGHDRADTDGGDLLPGRPHSCPDRRRAG